MDFRSEWDVFMPKEIFDSLSESEKKPVAAIMEKAGSPKNVYNIEKSWMEYISDNLGMAYLALATPWRYTIVGYLEEDRLLKLLEFDGQRVNPVHSMFMVGSSEELLFDQKLSMVAGSLGNHNLSPENGLKLIEDTEAMWPYGDEPGKLNFPELLDHVLRDKWEPSSFSDGILAMIHGYLLSRGKPELAKNYSLEAIEEERRNLE